MTLGEAALWYAQSGFRVFPLVHKGKRPITKNGFKNATSDPQTVREWWRMYPDANIGFVTGNGLMVVDVDMHGKDGKQSIKQWEDKNGPLPMNTWLSKTGGGGAHAFFKVNQKIGNKKDVLPGVDIRGDGGYIVAPPSIHESGNLYEWIQEPKGDPAMAPDSLIRLCTWDHSGSRTEEQQIGDIIPEGNRTDYLFKRACSMQEKGYTDEAIRAAISAENMARCSPPLTDKELEREVLGALKRYQKGKRYPTVCDNGQARTLKEFKPIKSVTAAELDKMDIPPIEWIVDKILPVGLSMIGAPSKYYKSYMALGLCVAICNGDKFLGFDCNKHDCLYLDLESTLRRPKSRLDQILGIYGKKPDNLHIITGTDDPGRIGDGFELQIENQLKEHPKIKLIIVDVFQMIRQPAKKNQSGYDRDYDDFKILKQIADRHGLGLMLIHHTRKMKDPNDVFNELSGSVGVMGALDCAWVITKDDRYSEEGTLHITGRDMESQKLKIRFNKKTFQWEFIGTEEDIEAQRLKTEYEQSPVVETIKKLIKQGGGHWEGSASDIITASKYLSHGIYDDARKVGSLINKYEPLFWVDGIDYKYDRNKKKRGYIFSDINVTDVTNEIDVTNVTDVTPSGDG